VDELKINPKFKDVIPPLSAEEYENLRESIKTEGCRDAIIVWDGVIIDGHNRYAVCRELDIPFNTVEKTFADESVAIEYILLNQLARRNLFDVDRGRLTLLLKETMAARALKNHSLNGGDKKSEIAKSACPNLDTPIEKIDTKKELAKIAGLSHGTLAKIEKVDREAPAILSQAMGKTISIDRAAKLNDRLKELPEGERDAEAEALLDAEFKKEEDTIDLEERIMKKLHNIYASATLDYEYICADCVDVYIRCSPLSVESIVGTIGDQIEWLEKLKALFIARDAEYMGERLWKPC